MWCPAPTHTAYGRALMRALRARTAWAHAAPAFVRVCVSVRLRLRDGAGSDRDGVHIRQEGAPPASRLAPLAAAAAGPAAVRVSPHAHGTGGSLAADCGQWREHAFSVSMRTRCAASWTWAARVGQGTCACTVRVDVGVVASPVCGGRGVNVGLQVDPEQSVVRVSATRLSISILFDFVNTFTLDVALSGRYPTITPSPDPFPHPNAPVNTAPRRPIAISCHVAGPLSPLQIRRAARSLVSG
jgi:hypothetical protein